MDDKPWFIKDWDLVLEDLEKEHRDKAPVIEETKFVQIFLPHFYKVTNDITTAWFSVSKSVFYEVSVVSGGKEIYRVPALCNRASEHPMEIDSDWHFITSYATQLSNSVPHLVQGYLSSALGGEISIDNQGYESLKRWNDIFIRYNFPSIIPENMVETMAGNSNISEVISDEEEPSDW